MSNKFDNILQTIGRTPTVRIDKLAPPGIGLYVKVEAFNPMGSVKDRLALGVIEHAEQSGALSSGQTVVEATSGNTGIGLAMVCAQKGYPLVVTMAESFSVERRRLMRFLGAKVVLTPASEKGSGMLAKAVELADKHGWFLCRQFENEANADMHSRTTAPEILDAFGPDGLDYWVTGFGTGGTLKGVARVLKEKSPKTRIIVCEPDNAQLLGSGIGQQAIHRSKELAQKEGIFVGISSGATLAGAIEIAESAPEGSTVLAMLPDTGERYLTTPLFEDIAIEMTDEEKEISESTPGFRFGAPPPPADTKSAEKPASSVAPSAEADAFVAEVNSDSENPVVLYALEWCEFCWSVRKMFAHCGIPYRSIDLDSVPYQKDNHGGKIRAVLKGLTSFETIPQIFVGGEFIGGCTEVFDAYKEGRLQTLLEKNAVAYDQSVSLDPYSFCRPGCTLASGVNSG